MMLTEDARKAIFEEGRIAALTDTSSLDCPYPEDDERHAPWVEGYQSADPEFEK